MHEMDGKPATPEHDSVAEHVQRYYRLVDAGDIASLLALFTEDVVYRRPGYPPIRGSRRLEEFYRDVRVIDSGRHRLTEVVVEQSHAAVSGEFSGVLKDGKEVSVRFADFFVASESGLFRERETFFFAPMV